MSLVSASLLGCAPIASVMLGYSFLPHFLHVCPSISDPQPISSALIYYLHTGFGYPYGLTYW